MFLNVRLIVAGLVASAACTRALNALNLASNKVECGTPNSSRELSTTQGSGITKRQDEGHQRYRIPTYITVLAKNDTIQGGNITDSHIQSILNEFNKYFSFGFFLDASVDTIHRALRADLFDPVSQLFIGDENEIQRQYHRGEGDYASLNIIFLFRFQDTHEVKTEYVTRRTGYTIYTTARSSGAVGMSSMPSDEIWKYSNALDIEQTDGMFLSSAVVPGVAYPWHKGSLSVLPHEFGHWVGLKHTDYTSQTDAAGRGICDPLNDDVDDTPTHILDETVRGTLQSCPPVGQVNTCRHIDDTPDPIRNLMLSISYGCDVDGLTYGQRQRTMEVYRRHRIPYKQNMQQMGCWVQPHVEQPKNEEPKDQEAEDEQPKDQEAEDEQPKDEQPKDEQPNDRVASELRYWQQRLQSESNDAWQKFRQEKENYYQQIQQRAKQTRSSCYKQAQQSYNQQRARLDESTRHKYRDLREHGESVRSWLQGYLQQGQYRQWALQEHRRQQREIRERRQRYRQEDRRSREALVREYRQRRQQCEHRAREAEVQNRQSFENWAQEYSNALRGEDDRRRQFLDSLQKKQ
ncbi:Peptidase M43, pregnancy-associated plasma-A [Metarhizium rileyi]|uniref:Peptidase M43, pregnancy-associated plasma-A n=1 Tax=Metarhizium rileyi (strain RCEF 4871) TaxID=1649241 RepID=A0A166WH83_METRR|nr:Peptidase M43, pregnancy-associated plasma-A [Metarhizium rileyi RCEF 4871]